MFDYKQGSILKVDGAINQYSDLAWDQNNVLWGVTTFDELYKIDVNNNYNETFITTISGNALTAANDNKLYYNNGTTLWTYDTVSGIKIQLMNAITSLGELSFHQNKLYQAGNNGSNGMFTLDLNKHTISDKLYNISSTTFALASTGTNFYIAHDKLIKLINVNDGNIQQTFNFSFINGQFLGATGPYIGDRTPPSVTFDPVSDTETTERGTSEALALISIRINTMTYTGTADANGQYEITLPAQDAGTLITACATNAAGNHSLDVQTTVTKTFIPNNEPTVGNDQLNTVFQTSVSGMVVGSDADGDNLNYTKNSDSSNGVSIVNQNGSWTYTPNVNFSGTDQCSVTVSDGKGGTAVSTITIVVASEKNQIDGTLIAEFSVIFIDNNGNTIKSQIVKNGENAIVPKAPVIEGYEFIGWSVLFINVKSNLIIKALYKEIEVSKVANEDLINIDDNNTPQAALLSNWWIRLMTTFGAFLLYLLLFLRKNMEYTLTDGVKNLKRVRRRLAKHCKNMTVHFQLNGKVIHTVTIPSEIDDDFETIIKL